MPAGTIEGSARKVRLNVRTSPKGPYAMKSTGFSPYSIGNANVVKADVLFDFLRAQVTPLLP